MEVEIENEDDSKLEPIGEKDSSEVLLLLLGMRRGLKSFNLPQGAQFSEPCQKGHHSSLTPRWKCDPSKKGGCTMVTFTSHEDVVYSVRGKSLFALESQTGDVLFQQKIHMNSVFPTHIQVYDNSLLSSGNGKVARLSMTGEIIWMIDLKVNSSYLPVVVMEDRIFVCSVGYIFCLSPNDGQCLWKNGLKGKGFNYTTIVELSNDQLCVGTNGYLIRIDANTGDKIESYHLKGRGSHAVCQIIHSGILYVYSNGILSAHDPSTFQQQYKMNIPSCNYSCCMSITELLFESPKLLLSSQGLVMCIDHINRHIMWKTNISKFALYTHFCYDRHYIYVTTTKDLLCVLDPLTGKKQAKQKIGNSDDITFMGGTSKEMVVPRHNETNLFEMNLIKKNRDDP